MKLRRVLSTSADNTSSICLILHIQKVKTYVMCAWIVWIRSLSPSNHPRSDHAPIVIVIQSEHLKHSISLRNQSAKHPDSGCFGISGVVIGSTGAIKGMALWSRSFSRGSLFKTWPKPETAHEKPLAPSVSTPIFCELTHIQKVELKFFISILTDYYKTIFSVLSRGNEKLR